MEHIKQTISIHYKLNIKNIISVTGGWCASAYIAKGDSADYFIKIYDKHRPSVQPWIIRMDSYMPVTFWLYENTALRRQMIVPLLTKSQEYKVEDEDNVILVFPMLNGITPGDTHLSTEQIRQLASILAKLHTYGNEISVPTKALEENYSLPFLPTLTALINVKEKAGNLKAMMALYHAEIEKGIEALLALALSLSTTSPLKVLCHTDIHSGNLMWSFIACVVA